MSLSNFLSVRTLKMLILWDLGELLSLEIKVTTIISSWLSGDRAKTWGRHRVIHVLMKVDEGSWEPEANDLGTVNVTKIPDHPPGRSQEKKWNIPLLFGSIHPFLQPWSEEQIVPLVGYCREKDRLWGISIVCPNNTEKQMSMSTQTLAHNARKWEQPKCPPMDEWTSKI